MTELRHVATPGGPTVVTGREMSGVAQPSVQKVIVAVHGIGDQTAFSTIQAVVNQFCSFFDQPAGVPLGAFSGTTGAYSIGAPHDDDVFRRFGFAEVYWAAIPRGLADDKHKLEESKAWARTIVERLKLRYHIEWKKIHSGGNGDGRRIVSTTPPDFPLVKQVLSELITTLGVLDRLCFLADKAGLFTFDLRKLLDDYLGDVQVVAEFAAQRADILKAFSDILASIVAARPDAEIYIVAHSEGTVVALLGLIEAFRKQRPLGGANPGLASNDGASSQTPAWIDNVRGLMTLGSPIDKHLLLWPELFGETPPTALPKQKIRWKNYYDFGDPIGFELDAAREWIGKHEWDSVFSFSDGDDHGFARYALPGKAHVDYWNDSAVFGHFLQTVVDERPRREPGKTPPEFNRPPRSLRWMSALSYLIPYVAIAAILFAASYLLLDATIAVMPPRIAESFGFVDMSIRSAGLTALLAGVTVFARLPRLTRRWPLRLTAVLVALAGTVLYDLSVQNAPLGSEGSDMPTLLFALATVGIVGLVSGARPSWGVKPLLIVGVSAATARIGFALWNVASTEGGVGPLWRVLLALVAFAYLWWLGALLFDLVVAWHVYIRNFQVHGVLRRLAGERPVRAKRRPPASAPPLPSTSEARRTTNA